ncbi:hypothetical protein M2G95_02105 [Vibrio vulnificus]|uniref:CvpA family protein n=1 Tax=Vibrio vulnificus TaxID=672 RepID=UPI001115837C|nr:CvpA family protein [Vibrio vulnificus]EHU5198475.1 hypothetical protein [Vibrio vulnificus]MCU8122652.1 hypothetical protein [Vibrio vulnificus]MCU8300749.1 hypothetical protein [Vibrio vulnificus]MCU8354900.1 hypothetical protein [Vibrio vulnificus]MDK2638103.1 hypothetical protein [Vibrio vulnificus]
MNNSWVKVIAITGSVGVFAFLFSLLMGHVFSEKIVDLLGSEKVFYIIVAFISIFAICTLVALFKPRRQSDSDSNGNVSESETPKSQSESLKKDISVTYSGNSTHNGDNHF